MISAWRDAEMSELTYDPRDRIRVYLKDYYAQQIEAVLGITIGDTPIENVLFLALSAVCRVGSGLRLFRHKSGIAAGSKNDFDATLTHYAQAYPKDDVIAFEDQCQLGPYRVDFFFGRKLSNDCHKYLVVECDGHDFHNTNKEQASKDRQRDRDIQRMIMNCNIFRFTGTDIWADPVKCAEEILAGLLEV
jgi:very-short-patch-repair endonuclease